MKTLDIHSGLPGDAAVLSNLYMKPFIMDNVTYMSLEGFLQSLRFEYATDANRVAMLCGVEAKMAGRNKPIREDRLWYKGEPFNRHSKWYQKLLERAFMCCFAQNTMFQCAISNTRDMVLTHTIGKDDPTQTILTNSEFIGLLMGLRKSSEAMSN